MASSETEHNFYKTGNIGLLVGASVLQLIGFIVLLILLIVTTRTFDAGVAEVTQAQDWSCDIKWLDEVLTMSARVATLTGNVSWVARYNAHLVQLEAIFGATLDTLDAADRKAFEDRTFSAHKKLVELETLALGAVVAGRPQDGVGHMFSAQYDAQKRVYTDGLGIVDAAIDRTLAETFAFLTQLTVAIFAAMGVISPLVVLISVLAYRQQVLQARAILREKRLSEEVLFNTLPPHISMQLREASQAKGASPLEVTARVMKMCQEHAAATVCFMDMVGFTALAAALAPLQVVELLNLLFSAIDQEAEDKGVVKIKTMGDCYMAVSGLRGEEPEPEVAMLLFVCAVLHRVDAEGVPGAEVRLRCGVHTGPVVSAVLGTRKFLYDIFGDAVNTASRMESTGQPGSVQMVQAMAMRVRPRVERLVHIAEPRQVHLKGKGATMTCLATPRGYVAQQRAARGP